MSKDLSIPRRNKVNWHYVRDDNIFSTIKVVSRHQNTQQYGAILPIELTNEDIKNTKAYKEYYAYASGDAAPKPKASARRKRGGSDSSTTPPTVHGGSNIDEGTSSKPGVPDVPFDDSKKEISWNSSEDKETDDQEQDRHDDEGDEKDDSDDEETREEESFDPIPRTFEDSEDDGNGEEGQGLRISEEERIHEEEEADELYPSHPPIPPTPIPSEVLQNLPTFDSVFCFNERLKSLEASFSEYRQTNPFAEAVSNIPVASDLLEMELKKILIEKMEGNKSIQRSDEQRNLYKALVDAYEADKTILDSYGETAILKRRRKDDDDQEGPSARSDRGSKRRRECGEPESARAPLEPATRSAGRSTIGSKSRQVQKINILFKLLSILNGSSAEETSNSESYWNKTLQAVQGSAQTWISELAKQADSRSSFNELLDTPIDFSNFIMNWLRVDTLSPELLAGPTYELMRGSYNSLTDLEYHLEVVYKATTDQLDWVNPEGRRVIPFAHFINNDLEYLRGGASSRKYTTSVTKTKAADYGHIKWIEDLQESSSVSSFVTSMLNLTSDAESVNAQLEAEVLTRSSNSSRTSYAVAADLIEMELKKILIEKMEGNKSIQRSDEQRNLYKALVDAYKEDKTILESYGDTTILKRRRGDDDDQEGPSAGSDRGSKRRREGGEHESASTPSEPATRSASRSTIGTQSRQMSASKSAFAVEPVQTTCQTDEPPHPVFETGAEDQLIVQTFQHPEWFSQPRKPPTPDRDWNKTLPAIQGSAQTWISELAKQADSRSSFNELLDTLIDFSNFIMNRLGVDTLTPELLAGPTYELMKGSYNRGHRVIPFAHFINNDLEYLRGGTSSRKYTTSVTKTKVADYGHIKWIEDLVPHTMWIPKPLNYDKHALWGVSHWGRKRQQFYGFAVNREFALDISVRRDDDKIYKFKEGDFKRLRLQDIEDMLLLPVQGKLSNLTVEERFSFNKRLNLTKPDTYRSDLKRREAYTAYSNPRGFIYQNKDKKNRLMRINELHKFSDKTLNYVRNALDDRLKGIRMQYLPQAFWGKDDKDRAAAKIQSIDKMLKTRRIMRSLKRFVGGLLYERDFRMLQRTI
nr:hypothetical protein [Tanacetum cinerariifolium]